MYLFFTTARAMQMNEVEQQRYMAHQHTPTALFTFAEQARKGHDDYGALGWYESILWHSDADVSLKKKACGEIRRYALEEKNPTALCMLLCNMHVYLPFSNEPIPSLLALLKERVGSADNALNILQSNRIWQRLESCSVYQNPTLLLTLAQLEQEKARELERSMPKRVEHYLRDACRLTGGIEQLASLLKAQRIFNTFDSFSVINALKRLGPVAVKSYCEKEEWRSFLEHWSSEEAQPQLFELGQCLEELATKGKGKDKKFLREQALWCFDRVAKCGYLPAQIKGLRLCPEKKQQEKQRRYVQIFDDAGENAIELLSENDQRFMYQMTNSFLLRGSLLPARAQNGINVPDKAPEAQRTAVVLYRALHELPFDLAGRGFLAQGARSLLRERVRTQEDCYASWLLLHDALLHEQDDVKLCNFIAPPVALSDEQTHFFRAVVWPAALKGISKDKQYRLLWWSSLLASKDQKVEEILQTVVPLLSPLLDGQSVAGSCRLEQILPCSVLCAAAQLALQCNQHEWTCNLLDALGRKDIETGDVLVKKNITSLIQACCARVEQTGDAYLAHALSRLYTNGFSGLISADDNLAWRFLERACSKDHIPALLDKAEFYLTGGDLKQACSTIENVLRIMAHEGQIDIGKKEHLQRVHIVLQKLVSDGDVRANFVYAQLIAESNPTEAVELFDIPEDLWSSDVITSAYETGSYKTVEKLFFERPEIKGSAAAALFIFHCRAARWYSTQKHYDRVKEELNKCMSLLRAIQENTYSQEQNERLKLYEAHLHHMRASYFLLAKDYVNAEKSLLKARELFGASSECASVNYSLGVLHLNGHVGKENEQLRMGLNYLTESADADNNLAQILLGRLYGNLVGSLASGTVPLDKNNAIRYLRMAAARGNVQAGEDLVRLQAIEEDLQRSRALCAAVSNDGHESPLLEGLDYFEKGDYVSARRYLEKVFKEHDGSGALALARIHRCGFGTPIDYRRALDYLIVAIRKRASRTVANGAETAELIEEIQCVLNQVRNKDYPTDTRALYAKHALLIDDRAVVRDDVFYKSFVKSLLDLEREIVKQDNKQLQELFFNTGCAYNLVGFAHREKKAGILLLYLCLMKERARASALCDYQEGLAEDSLRYCSSDAEVLSFMEKCEKWFAWSLTVSKDISSQMRGCILVEPLARYLLDDLASRQNDNRFCKRMQVLIDIFSNIAEEKPEKKRIVSALNTLQELAQDDAEAAFWYSQLVLHGAKQSEYLQRGAEEGKKYLEIAAKKEVPSACLVLGMLYSEDNPIMQQDAQQALYWLTKAAELDVCDAWYHLGCYYHRTLDNPDHRTQAQAAFSRLIEKKSEFALPARTYLCHYALEDMLDAPGELDSVLMQFSDLFDKMYFEVGQARRECLQIIQKLGTRDVLNKVIKHIEQPVDDNDKRRLACLWYYGACLGLFPSKALAEDIRVAKDAIAKSLGLYPTLPALCLQLRMEMDTLSGQPEQEHYKQLVNKTLEIIKHASDGCATCGAHHLFKLTLEQVKGHLLRHEKISLLQIVQNAEKVYSPQKEKTCA